MPKFMYTFHLFKFAFRTMARSYTTHIGSVFNCLVVSVVCSFSFSPDIIIPFIFSVIPLYFGVHEKKTNWNNRHSWPETSAKIQHETNFSLLKYYTHNSHVIFNVNIFLVFFCCLEQRIVWFDTWCSHTYIDTGTETPMVK